LRVPLRPFLERDLAAHPPEPAKRARAPSSEEYKNHPLCPRPVIEHPRLHHQLFPACSVTLSACIKDIVEQRSPPDRIRVRFMFDLRQIEPVVTVCAHHLRVSVINLTEEFEGAWIKLADPGTQRRLHVVLYC